MELSVDLSVAKTNKYASRESGDTVEVVERPGGGITAVLVDGQGSGLAAKSLSLMLSARAVSMIKDGVRDSAVARALHDILYSARGGQVSASVELLSVDLKQGCVLLTRNSHSNAVVRRRAIAEVRISEQGPIGTSRFSKPDVSELPLESGLAVWVVSDGIAHAGRRGAGNDFELGPLVEKLSSRDLSVDARAIALLETAISADGGRPADDMSVVVLSVSDRSATANVRRMSVHLPVTIKTPEVLAEPLP
jgi:serine phosphatase RsbU (regulator of sigma subunit)